MLIAAPVAETGAPEDVVNDPVSWMLEPLVVKLRPVNPVDVSVEARRASQIAGSKY